MPIEPPDESDSFLSRCPARPEQEGLKQSLYAHLYETAVTAEAFLRPIGFGMIGRTAMWFHDVGKLAKKFTDYAALSERDSKKASKLRGRIDHSTAGAQFIWRNMPIDKPWLVFARQILALCIASHHQPSLIDCCGDGEGTFLGRMNKLNDETHYNEVTSRFTAADKAFFHSLLDDDELRAEWEHLHRSIGKAAGSVDDRFFLYGLFARYLFSVMTEADYRSASGRGSLTHLPVPDWGAMQANLENYVARFSNDSELNALRAVMSQLCSRAGSCEQGLLRLSLPTGAGKSIAGFRFALEHALVHQLDRIVYVVPHTTILDQLALVFQEALGEEHERSVLVHHSNLLMETEEGDETVPWSPEKKKLYMESCERWDVPIVLTTTVQFLNAMYARGKQNVRRMHSLTRSVIIFDEVQAVPCSSRELFAHAVRFWVTLGKSTALFCTATQEKPAQNSILSKIDCGSLIGKVDHFFRKMNALRKCTVSVRRENARYWTLERISEMVVDHARKDGSVLVIVNTKSLAASLAGICRNQLAEGLVYHLSTNMCPAHRKMIIQTKIDKKALANARENRIPLICVSTQLIEAGVDVDFDVVVRSFAGLDSCMQAAGRCNRDARLDRGKVVLFNPADRLENISSLKEISLGRKKMMEQLRSLKEGEDIFSVECVQSYYVKIDAQFREEEWSSYPAVLNHLSTNLVRAFSLNGDLVDDRDTHDGSYLRQAFKAAARAYRVIDDNTVPVVTTYGEGARIIEAMKQIDLRTDDDWKLWKELLREARKCMISLPENKLSLLLKSRAIYPIREEMDIYALSPKQYDDFFGYTAEELED